MPLPCPALRCCWLLPLVVALPAKAEPSRGDRMLDAYFRRETARIADACLADIIDHTHDSDPWLRLPVALETEPVAQRALPGPELLRHGLVDDRHRHRLGTIHAGKEAPGNEVDPDGPQILPADRAAIGVIRMARIRRWRAFDQKCAGSAVVG